METRNLVVHCKRDEHDVYVGRPSKWGNPFTVAEHGRGKALEMYRNWIAQPAQAPLRVAARAELKGKVLGCWCSPQPCHATTLAKIANKTWGQPQTPQGPQAPDPKPAARRWQEQPAPIEGCGVETVKSEEAIEDDICTPPANYSRSDNTVRDEPLLLLPSPQNVVAGAKEWRVTLSHRTFSILVNGDKVVGTPAAHTWMLGKSWPTKVKPWLREKGATGEPVSERAALANTRRPTQDEDYRTTLAALGELQASQALAHEVSDLAEVYGPPAPKREATTKPKSATVFEGRVTPTRKPQLIGTRGRISAAKLNKDGDAYIMEPTWGPTIDVEIQANRYNNQRSSS